MDGSLVFLFAAVMATWIVVFIYLLFVNGRLAGLRRQLDALERRRPHNESDQEDD